MTQFTQTCAATAQSYASYVESRENMNYLRDTFKLLDMTTSENLRYQISSDSAHQPIHYLMFMAYFVFYETCQIHSTNSMSGSEYDTVRFMESIMMHSQTGSWTQQWATSPQFGNGFVQLVLNQTQNNPATNVHQMQNDIFKLAQCYIDFVGVVTKVYGNFYTSEALQKIWMRVGQKMLMVMKRSCNASKEDIFHTSVWRSTAVSTRTWIKFTRPKSSTISQLHRLVSNFCSISRFGNHRIFQDWR